jgi:hypothetical protein
VNYWIVKGKPSEYDLNRYAIAGNTDTWRTKKPPRDWMPDDRLLFWSSSPRRELVAQGVFLGLTGRKNADGETLYRIKYLTSALPNPVSASELRNDAVCATANFLKPAVAQGVLGLELLQAHQMYRLLRRNNPALTYKWADIPDPEGSAPPDVDVAFAEGGRKLRAHYVRERNRALIDAKREEVLLQKGRLECEVCQFDFAKRYRLVGENFCEVHHLKPLSDLNTEAKTRLRDLAIVCANCHRMLHRKRTVLTLARLRSLLRDV